MRGIDAADGGRVDPDFAREVLATLYSYRRKRPWVAWVLLALFGWAGGHRFYLEKPGTGLAMLLTGGGLIVWWVVDAFRLKTLLREHDEEQERRRREGLPPIELSFMPPLSVDVLREPPPWTLEWAERGRARRIRRLVGDALVLLIVGNVLGSLAGERGGEEAVFAAVAVIGITLAGGSIGWMERYPATRALVHWTHRLRLFYYYNRPGGPLALLFRPVALVLAPFRRRQRAEARLYIEMGAVFTAFFLLLDALEDVGGPMLDMGLMALAPPRLLGIWIGEVLMTFILIYAFVTPIGAVLNHSLLTRRTHTIPRVLGGVALLGIVWGFF